MYVTYINCMTIVKRLWQSSLVWPHEVQPWFHSWYRRYLDAKYNLCQFGHMKWSYGFILGIEVGIHLISATLCVVWTRNETMDSLHVATLTVIQRATLKSMISTLYLCTQNATITSTLVATLTVIMLQGTYIHTLDEKQNFLVCHYIHKFFALFCIYPAEDGAKFPTKGRKCV